MTTSILILILVLIVATGAGLTGKALAIAAALLMTLARGCELFSRLCTLSFRECTAHWPQYRKDALQELE